MGCWKKRKKGKTAPGYSKRKSKTGLQVLRDKFFWYWHLKYTWYTLINWISSIQVSGQCRNLCVALVKREIGANPIRTRHRNKGAGAVISLGKLGRWPMRWSLSRETCLDVVQKHLFQTTSNWLYVSTCRKYHCCFFIGFYASKSFAVVWTMAEDFFISWERTIIGNTMWN